MVKQNFLDIYIRDLQGNYYDINHLQVKGNDCIVIEIKKKTESYKHRPLEEFNE